jgi:hypothetical protein
VDNAQTPATRVASRRNTGFIWLVGAVALLAAATGALVRYRRLRQLSSG